MAREFPLFEEAVLFFEALDLNVEQYTKVAAAGLSMMRKKKKKSYYSDITGLFFQDGRYNRIQQEIRICAIEVRGE